MEYPRYTKSQDLRCKLTEKDIDNVRKLYDNGNGLSRQKIADKFNVTYSTILYWTDERNRQMQNINSRKTAKEWKLNHPEEAKEAIRRSQNRKWKIMGGLLRAYYRFINRFGSRFSRA